jgi:hypothetical protein
VAESETGGGNFPRERLVEAKGGHAPADAAMADNIYECLFQGARRRQEPVYPLGIL